MWLPRVFFGLKQENTEKSHGERRGLEDKTEYAADARRCFLCDSLSPLCCAFHKNRPGIPFQVVAVV